MAITVDAVTEKYIALRTEKSRIQKEAVERTVALDEQMAKLGNWLALKAEADGCESFKTKHGTVFWSNVDYAQVANWDAFIQFVIDNTAWDMLEKRVAKTGVRAHLQEKKEVPPGINYGTKRELNVRKPTKKEEVNE